MFYVCGVAMSSRQIHNLQRILVRDRRAVDTGAAFAVTSGIVHSEEPGAAQSEETIRLTPAMVDAVSIALQDSGGAEFDELRVAAERQSGAPSPH